MRASPTHPSGAATRSAPARLAAQAPLLALALLAACGDSSGGLRSPADALDLLAREPDLVVEQPGHLAPGASDEWGEAGLGGWYAGTVRSADGVPAYVPTARPEARLKLLATDPVDRDLVLTAWIAKAAPGSPGTVRVSLNGVVLKEDLALGPEPARVTVHAPAASWQRGANVLALVVPVHAAGNGAPAAVDTVAVAAVDYGPARRVERRADGYALPPSTGLRYDVQPREPARLVLAGRAAAEGRVEVRLARVDPATGKTVPGAPPARSLDVPAGDVHLELPLPARGANVLRIELAWRADGDAELQLDRLGVDEAPGPRRPPIFLISIDTLAARHLAAYGYRRETTPNIDALLDQAVLFERCIANAPWTTPSYMSALTGLFPRANRLEAEGPGPVSVFDQWCLADNRWTLAESMRARGYTTAGFVDTLWLDRRFRVDQGFDHWDESAAAPELAFENPAYGVAYVTQRAHEWLSSLPAGRTPFLFLHALDAHGPYFPELPFLGRFQGDLPAERRMALAGAAYQAARAVPDWMARTIFHGINLKTTDEIEAQAIPHEVDVDQIIARYDEAILKVDAYVGRFLDSLKAAGLWDDAVVVFTADHGEAFEPEFYGHARLYEDVLEVPLVIKLPHGEAAGHRIATGVQLVDLYPTLLELAGGGPPPAWMHGRSLLPLIRAGGGDSVPLFSEGGHFEGYSIIVDDWKLEVTYPSRESGEEVILTHPRLPDAWLKANFPELVDQPLTPALIEELHAQKGYARKLEEARALLRKGEPYVSLYDLSADPGETHDLAAERPDVVARLQPLLDRDRERAVAAQKDAEVGPGLQDLDPGARDELRKLGYGGGDEETPPDDDRPR